MALIATPTLQQSINTLLKQYHDTMYNTEEISKNNFQTDPATREAEARNAFSAAMAQAMEDYILGIIFTIEIGTLVTVGGPTTQVSSTPSIILKT